LHSTLRHASEDVRLCPEAAGAALLLLTFLRTTLNPPRPPQSSISVASRLVRASTVKHGRARLHQVAHRRAQVRDTAAQPAFPDPDVSVEQLTAPQLARGTASGLRQQMLTPLRMSFTDFVSLTPVSSRSTFQPQAVDRPTLTTKPQPRRRRLHHLRRQDSDRQSHHAFKR